MRKIVLFLFSAMLTFGLQAQQPDESAKRALEREIKVSGAYLYGEAVANTKEEATKMAKSTLKSEINKEALNHPEWQFAKTIQATGVEYGSDIIDLMRGNKFRVIAYIKKDNLVAVFDNKTPEVKLSDKKAEKSTTKAQPNTPALTKAVDTIEVATPMVAPKEKPIAPAETPVVPKEKAVAYMENDLLGQILRSSSYGEAKKILDVNKRKGKTAYGTMDKLSNPTEAYLLVYRKTGEVVAVLDKGTNGNRRNLISGNIPPKTNYEKEQIIWFQIYK